MHVPDCGFPPATHYETASRSDTSVIRGIGRHSCLDVLRCDARTPVAEGFAVGRNARRPGRLLPPQTRQIGAIRPFRRHRGRRRAPHGRTAVPGHGLLRAVAGEQLRDGDPPSRRSLHAPGEDHHFRRHDRRQPRTERRLRTTGPRRTLRSRHPPGDGARQPLCGAHTDLGLGGRHAEHRPAGTLPAGGTQRPGHGPVRSLPELRQPLSVGIRRLVLPRLPDGGKRFVLFE